MCKTIFIIDDLEDAGGNMCNWVNNVMSSYNITNYKCEHILARNQTCDDIITSITQCKTPIIVLIDMSLWFHDEPVDAERDLSVHLHRRLSGKKNTVLMYSRRKKTDSGMSTWKKAYRTIVQKKPPTVYSTFDFYLNEQTDDKKYNEIYTLIFERDWLLKKRSV